jgi:hypothetical protein
VVAQTTQGNCGSCLSRHRTARYRPQVPLP